MRVRVLPAPPSHTRAIEELPGNHPEQRGFDSRRPLQEEGMMTAEQIAHLMRLADGAFIMLALATLVLVMISWRTK